MQLTPQQVRSSQVGLIAQSALAAVAKEDPSILEEISARSINLEIKLNGRDVNMEVFCEHVATVSSLGRANQVLQQISGELMTLQAKVRNLDPMAIATRVANELGEQLRTVDLSEHVEGWVAPSRFHEPEVIDLQNSIARLSNDIRAHITT